MSSIYASGAPVAAITLVISSAAARAAYWDERRGLFADDRSGRAFSGIA